MARANRLHTWFMMTAMAWAVAMSLLSARPARADAFRWAGMKGTMDLGLAPIYGIQGVADPRNRPGPHADAVSWTDGSGALWLFGGEGYDCGGYASYLNDLWRGVLIEPNAVQNWTAYQ